MYIKNAQALLNTKAWVLFRCRQIFKFGYLRKER